jgi:hypothetical protein
VACGARARSESKGKSAVAKGDERLQQHECQSPKISGSVGLSEAWEELRQGGNTRPSAADKSSKIRYDSHGWRKMHNNSC